MPANNKEPMTAAEALSARVLLLLVDAKVEDAKFALDVVAAFVGSLNLKPGDRLSDLKAQDERDSTAAMLH